MASIIRVGIDFAEVQRRETEAEKERLLNSGLEYINIIELQDLLKQIGLKLSLTKDSLHTYYNNMNEYNYLEATTQPLDDKGISAYNVKSEFYQKELTGFRGEKGNELYRLRNHYFSTIKVGKKEYILSF